MSDKALLPTSGIQDPQTRAFLDRLVQVWGTGDFVSRREAGQIAGSTLSQALAGGVIGGASGDNAPITSAIENLTEAIRKSVLYRILETQITPEDLQALRNQVAAGMNTETTTRLNNDSVLASAINRIWGYIGGATAVITEGTLAAATPSTAVATAWTQVVAAVTDPNTGQIASASILEETRAYASDNDDTLNALYSVRAQLDFNGDTVVGGFGVAATAGAGSPEGPTIDFGVLANKFWIAPPSAGYDPATDYTINTEFPFIVVTTPTSINGVTYPAGVYMKRAAIGEAAIQTGNIYQHLKSNNFDGTFDGSGNIATDGTVGWALDKSGYMVLNDLKARGDIEATTITGAIVDTSNLVANAVTVKFSASASASFDLLTGGEQTMMTTSSFTTKGGTAFLVFGGIVSVDAADVTATVRVKRNDNGVDTTIFSTSSLVPLGGTWMLPPIDDTPPVAGHTIYYKVTYELGSSGGATVGAMTDRAAYGLEAAR